MKNAAANVIQKLHDAGYEAYLVGGCVRDLLLGKTPKDFDVTTNAHPEAVQALFPKTIPVGAAFGVIVVVEDGYQIEVATFRTDGQYSDARRPDEVFYSDNVRDDVTRRDFTMNGLLLAPDGNVDGDALLFDEDTGFTDVVVDHVGGMADLKAGVVRAIGNPKTRFTEDALRMLRAVRFAAQLGFEVEAETKRAIFELGHTITKVSRERVREELLKLLTAPYVVKGLALLYSTGLFRHLFGMLVNHGNGMYNASVAAQLERFERFSTKDAELALAMFLYDFPLSYAKKVAESLKLSNEVFNRTFKAVEMRDDVVLVSGSLNMATVKRMARKAGCRNAVTLVAQDEQMGMPGLWGFSRVANLFYSLTPEEINPKPLVTGDDLVAMGLTPGPKFKAILYDVETVQLKGGFNGGTDREAALEYTRHLVSVLEGK